MNIVYIAKSLDGFIADRNDGLEWLHSIPNPENDDMGWIVFNERIDAIIMGRRTFEVVAGFDMEWPYKKPVFVLSTTLKEIPERLKDKVWTIQGTPAKITEKLKNEGYNNLYIDGGKTVNSFLKADLIDELIISTMPILLGGGVPLFGDLPESMEFEHIDSKVYLNAIVQDSYRRKR